MCRIKQAVILAGGLGTRLKPFTDHDPKPMFPIEGKPFIEHLILQVKEFGITEVLILLGYLPQKVMDYLGNGTRYGLKIRYDVTPVEYETGLRIRSAQDKLDHEFLLMYCDNYCPIDFKGLYEAYIKNNAFIQITAYSNRDGYTKSNLLMDQNGLVSLYDKKRITPGLQGVDIGYAIVNKKALELMPDANLNFEATVYPSLVNMKKLYATVTEHRYYSIGSFERIEQTRTFFSPRKVIFLDRDGTLNVRPPKACYIQKPEEFIWLEGARQAVKILKDRGYFIILVSNQPGIARGYLTEAVLTDIHAKMQNDLKEYGACIDKIYYCPHNWDEGCECRKPKPGMFFQAQKEFSLNLTKCIMIGDDERDMIAGKAAGCQCFLIDENHSLLSLVEDLDK